MAACDAVIPIAPSLAWLRDDGGASDSSDDELCSDGLGSDGIPRWPLPPWYGSEMLATWDLLSRPMGMSLRKLRNAFVRRHGPPADEWEFELISHPFFILYQARRDAVGAPRVLPYGYLPHPPYGEWSSPRVRRLWPEEFDSTPGLASFRLHAAQLSVARVPERLAAAAAAAPRVHAGARRDPLVCLPSQQPAAFSHRMLERRSDGELLLSPWPSCNEPRHLPFEDPPPVDFPELTAFHVSEVVSHNALRRIQSFFRRWRGIFDRLDRGKSWRSMLKLRPPPVKLDWWSNTKAAFKGVPMDFTCFPFRTLQPSRWPDRPPSSALHIRAIRQDFRDYPIPNRWLRGAISHGNPAMGSLSMITFLDGPHGSALEHFSDWSDQCEKEITNGWSRASMSESFGLASWPSRCQPTSMVGRNGSWRLCHNMSWPLPGMVPGVEAPNATDCELRKVSFAQVTFLALAAAIFKVAGSPVRQCKADLKKAYKQNGQQAAARWGRSYMSRRGSQTLDRVCFGQNDGPFFFSDQSDVHIFILRREFQYADACYPTRDVRIAAWQEARRQAALDFGASDPHSWSALSFAMAMMDDFGVVGFDDLLWRIDGTAVRLPDGRQRSRMYLYFSILKSMLRRWGYSFDPDKLVGPNTRMVLLGVEVDLLSETLRLDPEKRSKYLQFLLDCLALDSLSVALVVKLAFRMLVVCGAHPAARQWLHSVFRLCRGRCRSFRIAWVDHPEALADVRRFEDLLQSHLPLAVPLASRLTFPFAGEPHLLVKYEDASGRPLAHEHHRPGFGSWAVRDGTLFYFWGLWSPAEARLPIAILEFLVTAFSVPAYLSIISGVTHILEFTDNRGAEFSAEREAPHAELMQRVAAQRSAWLAASGVFVRSARVSSDENVWADALSRQQLSVVLDEAVALGLRLVEVPLPLSVRDTSWLMDALP